MTYRYPADRKAHVRKTTFFGAPAWEAGRPGFTYMTGQGWHFSTWQDALDHALSTHSPLDETRPVQRWRRATP